MPTEEPRPVDSGEGKPSRKGFSEDGRGGTKPTAGMRPGARYLYYRLYTKDGPLESKNPIYSSDYFISRIASSSVRPPHTTVSLVKHLCKIEGLAPQNCILFQSVSDKTALDDSARLSLKGTTGPGASDLDAMALVVDKRAAESRSLATGAVQTGELLECNYEQRYVYYCVYDDDGEIASKTSFDENKPSLGRVNTLSVPPPHTVSSLKSHIVKSEDLLGDNIQLLEDEGSESAMNDSDALTLLSDTFPGYTEDRPIAITYESGTLSGPSDNEDSNEIQIRELRETLAQNTKEMEEANKTHAHVLAEVIAEYGKAKETHHREINEILYMMQLIVAPTFRKKLRATEDFGNRDSRWHSIKTGEIFYTDGICRRQKFHNGFKAYELECYLVTNSFGKLAFVGHGWTAFC